MVVGLVAGVIALGSTVIRVYHYHITLLPLSESTLRVIYACGFLRTAVSMQPSFRGTFRPGVAGRFDLSEGGLDCCLGGFGGWGMGFWGILRLAGF